MKLIDNIPITLIDNGQLIPPLKLSEYGCIPIGNSICCDISAASTSICMLAVRLCTDAALVILPGQVKFPEIFSSVSDKTNAANECHCIMEVKLIQR